MALDVMDMVALRGSEVIWSTPTAPVSSVSDTKFDSCIKKQTAIPGPPKGGVPIPMSAWGGGLPGTWLSLRPPHV